MTPATLITEHLDTWTSAIKAKSAAGRGSSKKQEFYGIKKLRELILELAKRGLLVSQDPADNDAKTLIKEIAKEKERLIKQGRIKKRKELPVIKSEEIPFKLPKSWEWVRLGDIQEFTNGFAFKSADLHDGPGVGVVKIGDVYRDRGIDESKMQFVSESIAKEIDHRYVVAPNDLVITMTGDVKIGFNQTNKNYLLNQRVGKIECFLVNPKYIHFQLITVAEQKINEASGGVIPNVSTSEINETLISLPPLAEQHRIVAKVDELMALCDQLERQQEDSVATHGTLVQTLLGALTAASERGQFDQAWQRIHAHFDTLFTTESSIDQLKQTILQLAVMGKLVKQDPRDGNARELIYLAMKKRDKTIKSKKLRRKQLDESTDLFSPNDLPASWCLERFANIVDPENTISYGVLVPGDDVVDGVPFVRAQDLSLSNQPARPNKTIAREIEEPYARTRLTGGEILLCVVGSIGKLGTVPESWAGANIARAVARIKPISEVYRDYLLIVLQSAAIQKFFASSTRTLAQPTLNVGLIEQTPIPIPPLTEQRRIVAKVDQLTTLCDRLKASLQTAQTTQLNLADTLVASSAHE